MKTEVPITVEYTPTEWLLVVSICKLVHPELRTTEALGRIVQEAVENRRYGEFSIVRKYD